MSTVSIVPMDPEWAITATERITAAVAARVKSHGEEAVTKHVTDSAAKLEAAAEPLAKLKPAPFAQRRDIDTIADRCAGELFDMLSGIIRTYDQTVVKLKAEQQAQLDAARTLLANLYAEGKGFLKGPWAAQFGHTAILLSRAGQAEMQGHIATLSLEQRIDFMREVHKRYGELMGFTTSADEDSMSEWHKALEHYLAAVIFTQADNPELRAMLTEPYEKTAEEIRAARRRPRKKPEDAEEAPAEAPAETTSP